MKRPAKSIIGVEACLDQLKRDQEKANGRASVEMSNYDVKASRRKANALMLRRLDCHNEAETQIGRRRGKAARSSRYIDEITLPAAKRAQLEALSENRGMWHAANEGVALPFHVVMYQNGAINRRG